MHVLRILPGVPEVAGIGETTLMKSLSQILALAVLVFLVLKLFAAAYPLVAAVLILAHALRFLSS